MVLLVMVRLDLLMRWIRGYRRVANTFDASEVLGYLTAPAKGGFHSNTAAGICSVHALSCFAATL
jgi:hypothetical protein